VKGGVAVEFEEESGVMYHIMGDAKEKGPLAKKKVAPAPASATSIDDIAQLSGKAKAGGKQKKENSKISSALLEEFLLQHKLLEDEVRHRHVSNHLHDSGVTSRGSLNHLCDC